ncbi:sensor histidine kinase [Spirosoma arboris]|uniref:sensor histidine kinase n=1 Tax=Spirosoma arboris TaxID=2682092 RepID=UPI001D1110CB|nr:sensor histidine kinase [Spirosoma arboris]
MLLLSLGGFITLLLFLYKQRYKTHQQELIAIEEINQRKLLQSQLDTQNQTLKQIAHELHDNIGQLLSVVVMRLNTIEDETAESVTEQSVQQTRNLVRTVIADVRMMSKTLDYDTVGRFGLLPSLTLELERIEQAGRIHTQLNTIGEPYSLEKQTEMVLLRMTQEALNNAIKHAQAKTLTVMTDYSADPFILTIVDDGRGFNVSEATSRTIDQSGSGLNNLQHRAGLLGGTCIIRSQPGAGSRIEIRMPRNQSI